MAFEVVARADRELPGVRLRVEIVDLANVPGSRDMDAVLKALNEMVEEVTKYIMP